MNAWAVRHLRIALVAVIVGGLFTGVAGTAVARPSRNRAPAPFADDANDRDFVLPGATSIPRADPSLASTFDALDRAGGHWYLGETNDRASRLAWGESYVLAAYLAMYEATGERRYLDKFVRHAAIVVAETDRARGVTDYRGRSTGAWRCGNTHTVARLQLVDRRGRPVLAVFSRYFNANNLSRIRVLESGSSTFALVGRNPWVGTEEFYGLSLNPRRASYVARRVNLRSEFLTVRRVGYGLTHVRAMPRPTRARAPVPYYYHFVCQTGVTAYPLVHFYNVVKADATLTASYEETASRFLAAARSAVAVHDDEWVNAGSAGYYRFRRGAPVWSDGVEMPHNKLFAIGRTLVELYTATGDPVYRDRVVRLARLFKRHVWRNSHNAYMWRYWWGRGDAGWRPGRNPTTYTPYYEALPRIEDLAHGGVDVEFVATARRAGIVFSRGDEIRFANTLYANMRCADDTLTFYANGRGREGTFANRIGIAGWLALAPISRDVYRISKKVLTRTLRTRRYRSGVLLYAVARTVQSRVALSATTQPLRAPGMRVLGRLRSGSRVRGRFTLALRVTCQGRARLAFYLGRRRVCVVRGSPYRCRFNTRGMSNGRHLFKVVATEREGRTSVLRLYLRVAN